MYYSRILQINLFEVINLNPLPQIHKHNFFFFCKYLKFVPKEITAIQNKPKI